MADRGPQGRDNRARSTINLRPEDGYLQLVFTILLENEYFPMSSRKLSLINLNLLPLVEDNSLVGICIDTDGSYFSLTTLKTSIISPLILLYLRVGRRNFLRRSS